MHGEKYSDKLAYAPAFYGSRSRESAQRVTLKEGAQIDNVDIVVGSARPVASVILDLRFEDGNLVTATGISSKNVGNDGSMSSVGASGDDLNGVQRVRAERVEVVTDGRIRLSAWLGETYNFKATRFESRNARLSANGTFRMDTEFWEGWSGPVHLTEHETIISVTLHPKDLGAK